MKKESIQKLKTIIESIVDKKLKSMKLNEDFTDGYSEEAKELVKLDELLQNSTGSGAAPWYIYIDRIMQKESAETFDELDEDVLERALVKARKLCKSLGLQESVRRRRLTEAVVAKKFNNNRN